MLKQLFPLMLAGTLSWLAPQAAHAQTPKQFGFQYKRDVPVIIGSDTLVNAWAGGFNSVHFSKIDLNGDAQEDLFLFDQTTHQPLTFLAEPKPGGGWQWRHTPAYETMFPRLNGAYQVLLRDFDGDGRKDIFCVYGSNKLALYRNILTPNGLNFTLISPALHTTLASAPTIDSILTLDVYGSCSIEDADGDGDLDVLSYGFLQNFICLYRNSAGVGATPSFHEEQMWGGIFSCQLNTDICNSYALQGASCRPAPPPVIPPSVQPQHNGYSTTLLLADLDRDGDLDLLHGKSRCRELAQFLNSGTSSNPVFTAANLTVPAASAPQPLVHTPTAQFEDVTFDGNRDLLVTPWIQTSTFYQDQYNTSRSAALYTSSSGAAPTYTFQGDNFLQSGMIDEGEQAAPALADLDGDGDLDLLVGNIADFVPLPGANVGYTSYRAGLRFYRNDGTAQQPVFRLITRDFAGLSALNIRAIVPVLTDLNNDGKVDLVIRYVNDPSGSGQNTIGWLLNTAPVGQLATYSNPADLGSFDFSIIYPGNRDLPYFYDVDGDGLKDLLFATGQSISTSGLDASPLWYFHNTNTGDPRTSYQLVSQYFGQLPLIAGNSLSVAVADLDGNGQPELLGANAYGELTVYPALLQNPNSASAGVTDLVRNDLTTVFEFAQLGPRPVIAVGDLTGDGIPEVIVGAEGGGLRMLERQTLGITGLAPNVAAKPALRLQLHPNPATAQLTITASEPVRLTCYDLLGRAVPLPSSAIATTENTVAVDQLAAGLYVVRATTADGRSTTQRVMIAPER